MNGKSCQDCKFSETHPGTEPCASCAEKSKWISDGSAYHAERGTDPKSSYYDAGGYGVIEVIKAKLTPEQFQGFLLGNCMKYSLRANWKGQFDRDVEKIGVYSKWLEELNK